MSEDDEADSLYTENELISLNAAQLSRSRTKRALVPFVIAGIAVLLLVSLIVGIALLKRPGTALKGYSVNANDVSPAWSASVLRNTSVSAPYVVHNLVRTVMQLTRSANGRDSAATFKLGRPLENALISAF